MNTADTPTAPIRCPNPKCGAVLGESGRLFFAPIQPAAGGGVLILSRCVLTCRECGTKRTWRPDRKGLAGDG